MGLAGLATVVILTGVVVVFVVLFILNIAIKGYSNVIVYLSKIFREEKKIYGSSENLILALPERVLSLQEDPDDSILAVISAAAATFVMDTEAKRCIVKSICENNPVNGSAWKTVGLIQNTTPFEIQYRR